MALVCSSSTIIYSHDHDHVQKRVRDRKVGWVSTRASIGGASTSASSSSLKVERAELSLLDSVLGVQGRGRGIPTLQLQRITEAIQALERDGGVDNPTSSGLIEGRWRLMFTTRPDTASPIQRTFVGVNAFSVLQEIILRDTEDPRVSNIVQFSEAIGELKVEAAASVENGKRILFKFDRAAFSFKFLPFKVPYPVPFRLLGDEAKGWLDTTYLSPSGNLRISRGNKGTTFVLQKEIDCRQRLLLAIAKREGVEEVIDEVIATNPSKDLEFIVGKWRLLWSSQAQDANWIQKASSGFSNWQIVKEGYGELENLVEFFPGLRLRAEAKSKASSDRCLEVKIEGAVLEVGSFKLPVNITGSGFTEVLYLDERIRITRGNKGSIFIHIRDE